MRRILAQSHLDVTCQRKERLPKEKRLRGHKFSPSRVLMSLVMRKKNSCPNNGKEKTNNILEKSAFYPVPSPLLSHRLCCTKDEGLR